MNDAHDVIDDARDVLLEKVGLEPIKRARKVLGEERKGLATLRIVGRRGGCKHSAVHGGYFFQDFFGVLKSDFAVVVKAD